jgi:hypothetical protein
MHANLDPSVVDVIEHMLKKYKDVFAWTYKDLRCIPLHLVQHQIEFDTNILASHQT